MRLASGKAAKGRPKLTGTPLTENDDEAKLADKA